MVFDFEKQEETKDEVTLTVTYRFTKTVPRSAYPEEMSVEDMARVEAEACKLSPAETVEWGLESNENATVVVDLEYRSSRITASGEDILSSS